MNNARLTHAHGTVISILREVSLSPLGNLTLDGDAVVLDKLLHDTEKTPVVVVLRVFRENLQRACHACELSLLAELAAVEHDEVLHRVESSRSLVGVNERLAHLGLPLHVHTGVVELLEIMVEAVDVTDVDLDPVTSRVERIEHLRRNIVNKDMCTLDCLVGNTLATLDLQVVNVLLQVVEIVVHHVEHDSAIEETVSLIEILEVTGIQKALLHANLLDEHLP